MGVTAAPEPPAEPDVSEAPAAPVSETAVPEPPAMMAAVSVGGGRYRDCKVNVRVDHPAVMRGMQLGPEAAQVITEMPQETTRRTAS